MRCWRVEQGRRTDADHRPRGDRGDRYEERSRKRDQRQTRQSKMVFHMI